MKALSLFGIAIGFALAPISTARANNVVNETGNLQQYLESIFIPPAATSVFRLPTHNERLAFRDALEHVLDGDLVDACDDAVLANYDVVSYDDTITSDTFTILREKNTNQHWGGLFIVDPTPERTLVVESPHPLFDGVRVPAIDLFFEANAVAFFQAGTHRNNSLTEINCDNSGTPYRISDVAHSPESLFQVAHEVVEAHFERTVSLSFHGMAEDSDPTDVVVSNGTGHQFLGHSLSRDLATRMNEILTDANDSRVAVSHQEPGENPSLAGSTNTQGRATNGSAIPCTVPAPTAIFPERFIHLECDPDVRSGDPSNWAFVVEAVTDLVPDFSDSTTTLPTGDLVITELMTNPGQVGDGTGEFIELFNHTGAPITMNDWTIADRQGNAATFSGVIQPGDLFVVGGSGDVNGGADGGVPDAVWSDSVGTLFLTDTGDTISVLDDSGYLVASVTYGEDPFGVGVALEIDVANTHLNGQTEENDYVASTTAFGADLASPGTRGESHYPLHETQLTFGPDNGAPDMVLEFPSARAVTYRLWKSHNLASTSLIGGLAPVIGDGETAAFTFPVPLATREFYQLHYDYAAPE
ncbi:MAG: lamin tail domain-containing protein [Verrucomicrobiota bacterium]